MEDAGYFSDSESTSDYHPVLRGQPVIVDVETDIANYNKRQLELYAKDSHGSVNKNLGFFPPHSNENPRTSQEIQRLKEYSKPLYQSNADFLTAAGLASRISHHQHGHNSGHHHLQLQQQQHQQKQQQQQQRHQSNASQATQRQQQQQQPQRQQADRSTGVYLGHEYLRGRSPSLGRLSVSPVSNHRSNVQSFRQPSPALPLNKDPVSGSVQHQSKQSQSQQGLLLKDIATRASVVGSGYGSEYSPTKQNLFRSLQRQMIKEDDDDDDDDDDDHVEDKKERRRDRHGHYRASENRESWSWSKEDLSSSMQQQQHQHQQKHQQSKKPNKSKKHSKHQERAGRFSSSTAQPRHSIPAMEDVESDDEDTRATQRSKVKSHKKNAKGHRK